MLNINKSDREFNDNVRHQRNYDENNNDENKNDENNNDNQNDHPYVENDNPGRNVFKQ